VGTHGFDWSLGGTNQWCLSASSIGRYDVGHFTDHYKIASWCVLGGIIQRGSISGRGGDSPLGNGDPVSICVKIQAHHHSNTGTSVSQPPSRHCFQVFLSNFFGVFWVPYMISLKTLRVTVLLMTLIVNHFGLADCRIDVNRRKRGRAHPQYTCRAGQKRFSRKSGHFRQAVYCSSNIPGSSQLVIKIQKLMLRVRLVKQPVISPSIPWAHPC